MARDALPKREDVLGTQVDSLGTNRAITIAYAGKKPANYRFYFCSTRLSNWLAWQQDQATALSVGFWEDSLMTPYRASGLNLIVAAIILWNTRYLAPAFVELARRGHDVSPELIRHVAPLGWQHIALTGDYSWNLAAPLAPDALRPLRNESSILAA